MNADEKQHAELAPSAAHTWIQCPASIAAQRAQPDESSEYADEGTAAHTLMAMILTAPRRVDASDFMGQVIKVGEREFEVDDEMVSHVQAFVDGVRGRIEALKLAGAQVDLRVEVGASITHITGEDNAYGTIDAEIVAQWPDRAELEIRDLKYGRGVEVRAEWNTQLMIYAEGVRHEYEPVCDFDTIRLVIHQPRVADAPDEWEIAPQELLDWIDNTARPAAQRARSLAEAGDLKLEDFWPGEAQCRFCKAKAVCPALVQHVEETLGADFEAIVEKQETPSVELLDNERLGEIYPALPLIEAWGKAVLARIEYELMNGRAVPGTKLVQGRRGHRKWRDEQEIEDVLKSMRLKSDVMYNRKVISPTQAEKLMKADAPRRWKKIEALITQKDGAPHVAHESDKREALVISPPEADFAVLQDEGDDLI